MERADFDDKDRKIISIYEGNPDISQMDIAREVGLSQPTVGARILKLKQSGAIVSSVGMDLKKIGLNLAKVDLTTRDSIEIINQFKNCPYFLNGMIVSGKENLQPVLRRRRHRDHRGRRRPAPAEQSVCVKRGPGHHRLAGERDDHAGKNGLREAGQGTVRLRLRRVPVLQERPVPWLPGHQTLQRQILVTTPIIKSANAK